MTTDSRVLIRTADRSDAQEFLSLIDELAKYEKLEPPDDAARDRLVQHMSEERPRFVAFLAVVEGRAVGYAIVFETYSTFLALPTLYLEDLFVLPEWRNRKIGYTLFRHVVREAKTRGCGRLEWAVLDWNKLAIDFYKRLNATHLKEWHVYRLSRNQFDAVGGD